MSSLPTSVYPALASGRTTEDSHPRQLTRQALHEAATVQVSVHHNSIDSNPLCALPSMGPAPEGSTDHLLSLSTPGEQG